MARGRSERSLTAAQLHITPRTSGSSRWLHVVAANIRHEPSACSSLTSQHVLTVQPFHRPEGALSWRTHVVRFGTAPGGLEGKLTVRPLTAFSRGGPGLGQSLDP